MAAVAAAVVTTAAVAATAAAAAAPTATTTAAAAVDTAASAPTTPCIATDGAALFLRSVLRATTSRRPLFRWNAGGPATGLFAGDADTGTAGITYVAPPRPIARGRGWTPVYLSHRLAPGGRLALAFPVPAGTYDVTLLWAEVWFAAVGERVLRVAVGELGGEVAQGRISHLDVVAAAGGANASLVRTFRRIRVKRGGNAGGGVLVTIDGLVQQPMLSGVVLRTSAKRGAPTPSPQPRTPKPAVPATQPTPARRWNNSSAFDSGADHRAHAVPGGPYVATDFTKSGAAAVTLDGILSHSHYFDAGPPAVSGLIVRYRWTIEETGETVGWAPRQTRVFPLGATRLRLTVTDNTGDVASALTTVTVRTAFTPGAYFYAYPGRPGATLADLMPPSRRRSQKSGGGLANLRQVTGGAGAPKPTLGTAVPRIAFWKAADFPGGGFASAAAVAVGGWGARLVGELRPSRTGTHTLLVVHDGPVRVMLGGKVLINVRQAAASVTTSYTRGVYLTAGSSTPLQVLYWQRRRSATLVVMALRPGEVNSYPLTADELGYDTAAVLPVLSSASRRSGAAAGGDRLTLRGSGLLNDLRVMFGTVEADNIMRTATDGSEVVVLVPPRGTNTGPASVALRVVNGVGASNALSFDYVVGGAPPVRFEPSVLRTPGGKPYSLGQGVTSAIRGPDGRYYFGTQSGVLHVLTVDEERGVVTKACATAALPGSRSILGLSFPPSDNKADRLYVSTSVLFWLDRRVLPYEHGWRNGRVDLYKPDGRGCFRYNRRILSGLPVSNHDHGVNGHAWDDDGRLYVSVGGSTNAGVAVRGETKAARDLVGGVPDSPLSGAVLVANVHAPGFDGQVTYRNENEPDRASVASGDVSVYATGVRNAFALAYTSRSAMYAVDNGPNGGYGPSSTSCTSKGVHPHTGDALLRIMPGAYYGSPNRARGRGDPRQCVYVAPMGPRVARAGATAGLAAVQSSTNGVLEYSAATFAGALRGELLLSKFAGQSSGLLYRARPSEPGAPTPLTGGVRVLFGRSGLAIFEDPAGGVVMADPRANTVTVLRPTYAAPTTPTLIGVVPRRGRAAGGTTLRITGHRLGGWRAAVTVGGRRCTRLRAVAQDGNALTCTAPAGPRGVMVDVVVTTPEGTALSYGGEYRYMRV